MASPVSPSHSTSIMRADWALPSDTALAQSARCTVTPRPRVMNPMMSSPGTGVQQRDSRTITSSRPSTCTPTPVPRRCRRGLAIVLGSCSSSSPVLKPRADPLRHRATGHVMLADGDVQRLEIGEVQFLGRLGQHVGAHELLDLEPLAAELADELLLARLERVLPTLAREPLADLVAGAGRLDDLQPVARRAGALHLRREDLARVAGLEGLVERHEAPVDPRADAGVAHLGVHGVGEVDRRGTNRQRDDPPLRREDEDLVLLEIGLQGLHELGRVLMSPSASR